jgi:hypothetical protein
MATTLAHLWPACACAWPPGCVARAIFPLSHHITRGRAHARPHRISEPQHPRLPRPRRCCTHPTRPAPARPAAGCTARARPHNKETYLGPVAIPGVRACARHRGHTSLPRRCVAAVSPRGTSQASPAAPAAAPPKQCARGPCLLLAMSPSTSRTALADLGCCWAAVDIAGDIPESLPSKCGTHQAALVSTGL